MKVTNHNLESTSEYPTCIIDSGERKYKIKCYPYGVYVFDIGINTINDITRSDSSYTLIKNLKIEYFNNKLDSVLEEIMKIVKITETIEDLLDIFYMSYVL